MLTPEQEEERTFLRKLQQSTTRWFSKEEFERLQYLNALDGSHNPKPEIPNNERTETPLV